MHTIVHLVPVSVPQFAAPRLLSSTPMKKRAESFERVSELLLRISQEAEGPSLTVGEIFAQIEDRSFGVLILLLALPSCFPFFPPGFTSVLGAGIALVAVQMVVGRHRAWLPGVLERRSISKERLVRVVERAAPHLRRCEALSRPRYFTVTSDIGEQIVGAFILALAVVISVPLPLTNLGPAVAIAVIAVGLIEEDGLIVMAGCALGALAIVLMTMFWGGTYLGIVWIGSS